MNKLAVFVEGQTEQLFAERLFEAVIGAKNLSIEMRKAFGGGGARNRRLQLIKAVAPSSGAEYHVMIVDCGTDTRVGSDVRDRYHGLVSQGFSAIVGIRDVYPDVHRKDIPKLRARLKYKLLTKPVEPVFVLAVMETEAWFIAEHTHFTRLSRHLSVERIKAALGFDPSQDDIQLRNHPADDLNSIYQLEGHEYVKHKACIQRTVTLLDYARVYLEVANRFPDLATLMKCIDDFLA